MKKVICLALVSLFALFFVYGCNSEENNESVIKEQEVEEDTDTFQVGLLENYPENLFPIHEDLVIINTFFQVVKNSWLPYFDGDIGNRYLVGTRTDGNLTEILDYYKVRMEDPEELYDHAGDISAVGKVGDYKLYVRTAKANNYPHDLVYIEVYLPAYKSSWENPYFEDYPEHLLPVPEGIDLYDHQYHISDNRGGEYMYSLDYDITGDLTLEDFVIFYETDFADEDNFEIVNEETIRWEKEGYIITVTYSADHVRVYSRITKPAI